MWTIAVLVWMVQLLPHARRCPIENYRESSSSFLASPISILCLTMLFFLFLHRRCQVADFIQWQLHRFQYQILGLLLLSCSHDDSIGNQFHSSNGFAPLVAVRNCHHIRSYDGLRLNSIHPHGIWITWVLLVIYGHNNFPVFRSLKDTGWWFIISSTLSTIPAACYFSTGCWGVFWHWRLHMMWNSTTITKRH